MGRPHNMSANVLHIRVTQRHDFTKDSTLEAIKSCVRSSNTHLWNSSPCTAGCWYNSVDGPNWKNGTDLTRLKIMGHWTVHKLMWRRWVKLAEHANSLNASITIEWADKSRLHTMTLVKKFAKKYGMLRHKAPGCVFGLTSVASKTQGLPLCKAWGIWTNNSSLSYALSCPLVRCQGGHSSIAVCGVDTEHSGTYPDGFARFVHTVLTTPIEDIDRMFAAGTLP